MISLREIAGETVSVPTLKEEMINSYQRFLPQDAEEDVIDYMDGEKEWGEIAEGAAASGGIYADEEVGAKPSEAEAVQDGEPSLSDIAGV